MKPLKVILMFLPKKIIKDVWKITKEQKGKTYGSFQVQKIKGGILYKSYYEMKTPDYYPKEDENPSYMKLFFPDKCFS